MKLFEAGADGGPGLRGQRWARLAFLWGVWALVGLFFSSQIYFYFLGTRKQMSLPSALAWQMSAVVIFALSTPLVLLLARRYRVERQTWRRAVPAHLLAGTLICSAWAAFHIILDTYFNGGLATFQWGNLPRTIFLHLDRELLVYWIIVVVSHAVDYYQRYREGELRASQAQLQALKMQLHPHFLFNALHSISALVHVDPDAADKMIARLGDFLRLTLESSAAQVVPLRQEIEFLNCYLEIERIRFRDRLTTRIEVDPQVLDCGVPNLILQPIVENAIRHGVSQRAGPGHVEVRAERAGTSLRLEVRDNGRGLPEGPPASAAKGGGVGLANTRARLQRLYGAAHRFELANAPAGGAVVTLEIPLQGTPAESPARPGPGEDSAALGSHAPGAGARAADPRAVSSRA
ncbi:MAG TPA: histidine kinase [Pyrinomonadaceae bacterium]|jgi:signal transduction histidine kinase